MHFNFCDFASRLPKMGKLMCIDLGRKQIGVAISDFGQKFVSDLFQIKSFGVNKDLSFFLDKIKSDNVVGIILGMPFAHVRKNFWIEEINRFAVKLQESSGLQIHIKDESMSTKNINFLTQNFSKKTKKKWKDKLSASCMLEEVLDTINQYKTYA